MPSSAPSFAELLGRCERSAVHLELRDSYASTDRFEAWKRGERINWADREAWWHPFHQLITDAADRGVVIRRARVVSEPASEYIRWEHYVTQANVTAGEEVRWLPRRRATDIPLPGNDFWLFDSRLVLINHFDGDSENMEVELSESPELAQLCEAAFEAVWNRATPHADFQAV